jgi:hypothetical protein
LLEINQKPVIIEAKTGKYDNFRKDINFDKMSRIKEAIKELYSGNDPDLVLMVPKDQIAYVKPRRVITDLGGKAIPFANTESEFLEAATILGVR